MAMLYTLGSRLYGAYDTLIARTAAKIPGDRLDNLIPRGMRIFFQQGVCAHQDTRRAKPALNCVVFDK